MSKSVDFNKYLNFVDGVTSDPSKDYKSFIASLNHLDREKMRLYDCEQSAQQDIVDSGQEEEYNIEDKKHTKSFAEFKF